MPATESIALRYAVDIGFAVVGELTRKPEWDGVASGPEIGLSGYCRVWVDEGGNAYYVHGKECEGMRHHRPGRHGLLNDGKLPDVLCKFFR